MTHTVEYICTKCKRRVAVNKMPTTMISRKFYCHRCYEQELDNVLREFGVMRKAYAPK